MALPNVTEYSRSVAIYIVKQVLSKPEILRNLDSESSFPGTAIYDESNDFLIDNIHILFIKSEIQIVIDNDRTDYYAQQCDGNNILPIFANAVRSSLLQVVAYLKVSDSVNRSTKS